MAIERMKGTRCIMGSRSARWLTKVVREKLGIGRSREPGSRPRSALCRWVRPLFVEELEPRLAPTAKIIYTAPPGGSDLTLRVAQVSGVANLQLFDNTKVKVI